MKNYVLPNGTEINREEMSLIHEYYEIECTTEYILENYDINEETARDLAREAVEKMNDYHLSEEEAVDEIMDDYFDEDDEEEE